MNEGLKKSFYYPFGYQKQLNQRTHHAAAADALFGLRVPL